MTLVIALDVLFSSRTLVTYGGAMANHPWARTFFVADISYHAWSSRGDRQGMQKERCNLRLLKQN